jgi:hypothetical protein
MNEDKGGTKYAVQIEQIKLRYEKYDCNFLQKIDTAK